MSFQPLYYSANQTNLPWVASEINSWYLQIFVNFRRILTFCMFWRQAILLTNYCTINRICFFEQGLGSVTLGVDRPKKWELEIKGWNTLQKRNIYCNTITEFTRTKMWSEKENYLAWSIVNLVFIVSCDSEGNGGLKLLVCHILIILCFPYTAIVYPILYIKSSPAYSWHSS